MMLILACYTTRMVDLLDQARMLVHPGKGILAADESNKSADEKRLAAFGIGTGPEMRRQFRDLFLEAPGVEKYLSGVILFEETLSQKDDEDGMLFPDSLAKRGIMPGIKVDQGLEPFPDSPEEMITKGLIGLPERLQDFKNKYHTGFTKWRAEIHIKGGELPTAQVMVENAKRLAMYACEVQKAGMVPMVEPEVLLSGNHSRLRSREVITTMMHALVAALEDQAVDFSGVIIKTSMALSGNKSGRTDTPDEVAEDTVSALMESIPGTIAGIVYLSGGQTPDQATANLSAIAKAAAAKNAPWPMTFSYARALQEEALEVWKGKEENIEAARKVYMARLEKVFNAAQGIG
jgi:fructose-bisphosphate aldolase class I